MIVSIFVLVDVGSHGGDSEAEVLHGHVDGRVSIPSHVGGGQWERKDPTHKGLQINY